MVETAVVRNFLITQRYGGSTGRLKRLCETDFEEKKLSIMEKLTDVELSSVVLEESKSRSWGKEQTNSVIVQEDTILTPHGNVHVAVQGAIGKPAIVTYHDIGLNHVTQFQGFFNFPDMQTLLKHFCVYHINGVGQEEGAAPLPQIDTASPADGQLNDAMTGGTTVVRKVQISNYGRLGRNCRSRSGLLQSQKRDGTGSWNGVERTLSLCDRQPKTNFGIDHCKYLRDTIGLGRVGLSKAKQSLLAKIRNEFIHSRLPCVASFWLQNNGGKLGLGELLQRHLDEECSTVQPGVTGRVLCLADGSWFG